MIEIESKIDEIDVDEVKGALKKLWAKASKKKLFRRYVFNLEEKAGEDRFIRLRTDGKKSTLTYKHRQGSGFANTEEVETEVKDFDAVARIRKFKILKFE